MTNAITLETWSSIPGIDKRYELSNLGRVRSFCRNPNGDVLKQVLTARGIPFVNLPTEGGVIRSFTISQLRKMVRGASVVFEDLETEEDEIWKYIPGIDFHYQVSNLGRVRSSYGSGRILKTPPNKNGYHSCGVKKDGKRRVFTVHQLVAMAFLDHEPDHFKLVVDHIDNDKTNNRVDNLQVVTNRHDCTKDRKNKTGHRNVYPSPTAGKFQVLIKSNGKLKNYGTFPSIEEAVAKRDEVKASL